MIGEIKIPDMINIPTITINVIVRIIKVRTANL